MKSEPPFPLLSPPMAGTSNRPVTGACNANRLRYPHQLQASVTGLLLVSAIGGDSGGDGGSDFIVLELPRTGRDSVWE